MSRSHRRGDPSHSLADLMAGLAITFLLLATVFVVSQKNTAIINAQEDAQKKAASMVQKELDRPKSEAEAMASDLRAAGLAGNIRVVGTEVEIDLGLSFDKGDCDITDGGTRAIQIMEWIANRVCGKPNARIVIEGHTDNEPFAQRKNEEATKCGRVRWTPQCADQQGQQAEWTPKCCLMNLQNNVRLSSARAENAFFAIREGIDAGFRRCLDERVVVAGRGPQDPGIDGGYPPEASCIPQVKQKIMEVRGARRVAARISFSHLSNPALLLGDGGVAPDIEEPQP